MPRRAMRKSTRKVVVKKPQAMPKTQLTRFVKGVIKRNVESKFQQLSTVGTTFNGGISATNEWYNPIPVINQGEAAFQRNGNAIRPTLLDMNWRISLGTGVTRSCDDVVVLYLFKCKNLRSYADMISRGSPNSFLNKGSQGVTPFTGVLNDIDSPVNVDAFNIVAKRVFKLTKGTGNLNNDGTTTYSGAGGVTSKHISVKIRNLPQFLYQQGNTDGLPENYGLCWALGYAKADGSSPDVLFQDVRVDFTSNLYYTDA